MRTLYDLCTADPNVRMSPPCWLAKFALLHKGLEFETTPLRFTEKANHPDPDYGLLPVLDDHGSLVRDSAEIITYLEKKYPDNPLWRSDAERAASQFYQAFLGAHIYPPLVRMLFLRVHNALAPEDQAYFRKTREERIGVSLEEFAEDAAAPGELTKALETLSSPLTAHSFFGGAAPNLSDYIVAAPMMWKRSVTSEDLFVTPPALAAWFERVLDLFDGHARKSPRAA